MVQGLTGVKNYLNVMLIFFIVVSDSGLLQKWKNQAGMERAPESAKQNFLSRSQASLFQFLRSNYNPYGPLRCNQSLFIKLFWNRPTRLSLNSNHQETTNNDLRPLIVFPSCPFQLQLRQAQDQLHCRGESSSGFSTINFRLSFNQVCHTTMRIKNLQRPH